MAISDRKDVNFFMDVESFHRKFRVDYDGPPRELTLEEALARFGHLHEELNEYISAVMQGDLEEALDALVDLVYVALGNAHLHGFDFTEAWRRVHWANMKKRRAMSAAESKRGVAWDIVKPEGWQPARLTDLVSRFAYDSAGARVLFTQDGELVCSTHRKLEADAGCAICRGLQQLDDEKELG